jgi:hypothetical protein
VTGVESDGAFNVSSRAYFPIGNRADNSSVSSASRTGFSGDENQIVSQAIDSTEAFTLLLAGLKALLGHNVTLSLVSDRFPEGLGNH